MGWETDPEPEPVVEAVEAPIDIGHARLLIVGIGSSMAILGACAMWWLHAEFFAVIMAGGAIAGPLAAWRRANDLAGRHWAMASARTAIEAVLIASTVLWAAWCVTGALSMDRLSPDLLAGAIGLALFIGFFGMACGLPFAMPVALATGWLVRRLGRWPVPRSRHLVWATAGVTVAVAVATGLSMAGVIGGHHPWR
jgi:hypothetical protein